MVEKLNKLGIMSENGISVPV